MGVLREAVHSVGNPALAVSTEGASAAAFKEEGAVAAFTEAGAVDREQEAMKR